MYLGKRYMSIGEYERRKHAENLIRILEKTQADSEKVKEYLEKMRNSLAKAKAKLENMTDEEFMEMLSKTLDPFAVASKSYYLGRIEKNLKELDKLEKDLEILLKYIHEQYRDEFDKICIKHFIERQMKGYIRRLKEIKKKFGNKSTTLFG